MKITLISRYSIYAFITLLAGCTSLPDNSNRPMSQAVSYTAPESTATTLFYGDKKMPEGLSGFFVMDNGLDAFVARIMIARRAERSIDLVTFMFEDDLVGHTVLNELIEAANRGVRVRLLLDDIWLGNQDEKFAAVDAHPNIEVRMFNPLKRGPFKSLQYITRFGSVTRRMHNKSFIVDNQVAVIGGRNIGDEYFDVDPNIAFDDVDALTIGPAVPEISDVFDQFWNNELSYPARHLIKKLPTAERSKEIINGLARYVKGNNESSYAKALNNSPLSNSLRANDVKFLWGKARVLADSPEKISSSRQRIDLSMNGKIDALFANSKSEVIIFTPYFIPEKEGAEGLIELEKRGTHLRILTNSLASNNHEAVYSKYAKYRKRLLEAGIELYELNPYTKSEPGSNGTEKQMLHAKMFVVDRQHTFIGSLNFDPRSWTENTEIGVVFESTALGKRTAEWFDNNIEQLSYKLKLDNSKNLIWVDGDGTEYTKEPGATVWKRFTAKILGWLPIESQL